MVVPVPQLWRWDWDKRKNVLGGDYREPGCVPEPFLGSFALLRGRQILARPTNALARRHVAAAQEVTRIHQQGCAH
jgi:hypothetical protein